MGNNSLTGEIKLGESGVIGSGNCNQDMPVCEGGFIGGGNEGKPDFKGVMHYGGGPRLWPIGESLGSVVKIWKKLAVGCKPIVAVNTEKEQHRIIRVDVMNNECIIQVNDSNLEIIDFSEILDIRVLEAM
jgi:hypothetical protein